MVAARTHPARSVATPVPGASWQAHVRDANQVSAQLHQIWRDYGAERNAASIAQTSSGTDLGTMPVARAATMNLISAARSRRDADRIRETIASLDEIRPSRATILYSDTSGPIDPASGLDVRIELLEQTSARGRPATVFECITIDVSAENEAQLASIASPLLMPDLPDVLWWATDPIDTSQLFTELVDVCDRLIIDSAMATQTAAGLRHLCSFAGEMREDVALGDLAWARLSPWRRLTTQFFDAPGTLPVLDLIDDVSITYGNSAHHWSGFSGALLYAGWLGSRLGWRTPGELLPVRGDPNVWRATLRAGSSGREREVSVTLRPTARPLAASTLLDVKLAADGGKAGVFKIDRLDENEISTSSDMPDAASIIRTVFAPIPGQADLLADQLRVFSRDPVFEAALLFAAWLAPSGFTGVAPR
ncbi:MAG: glucose-6-phosphate dehydrogenase assembly protein OpcA [Thermomicrobiales bacterium]|nr:glucose-6-phosphate dehydrogenase assembly protein OpcA [Thermomicrobiales bacterium]